MLLPFFEAGSRPLGSFGKRLLVHFLLNSARGSAPICAEKGALIGALLILDDDEL